MNETDRFEKIAAAKQKLELYRKSKNKCNGQNVNEVVHNSNETLSDKNELNPNNCTNNEAQNIQPELYTNESRNFEYYAKSEIQKDEQQDMTDAKNAVAIMVSERNELTSRLEDLRNEFYGEKERHKVTNERVEELETLYRRVVRESDERRSTVDRLNVALDHVTAEKAEMLTKLRDYEQRHMEAVYRPEELESRLVSLSNERDAYQTKCRELEGMMNEGATHSRPDPSDSSPNVESDSQNVNYLNDQLHRVEHQKRELQNALKEKDDYCKHLIESYEGALADMRIQVDGEEIRKKELEIQLSNIETEMEKKCSLQPVGSTDESLKKELEERERLIQEYECIEQKRIIQSEKFVETQSTLSLMLDQKTSENAFYQKKCTELNAQLEGLQEEMDRINETQSDHRKLVKSIEGDKQTISKALSQNQYLKDHVTEIENAFVEKSRENMELATRLQNEQHLSTDLSHRLDEAAQRLDIMSREWAERELERDNLKVQLNELSKSLLTQTNSRQLNDEQISDKSSNIGDQQNHEANKPNHTTNLHSSLVEKDLTQHQSDEKETAELGEFAIEYNEISDNLSNQSRVDEANEERSAIPGEKIVSRRQYLASLRRQKATSPPNEYASTLNNSKAVSRLEQRFKESMDLNAELRERIDTLEHLITLLEGESECIGEYIAIYHAQRDYLNKRNEAREHYLVYLIRQQTELKKKFAILRNLIITFMQDKNVLKSYENDTKESDKISTTSSARDSKDLSQRILELLNGVIEPLVSLDYPFSHTCIEQEGGGEVVTTGTPPKWNDPYFPTFSEYHASLPQDHVAACKCCQGLVKTL